MEHGYPDIETVTLEDGAEELGTEEGDILDSLLPLAGKAALQVAPLSPPGHQEAGVAPDEEPGVARSKLKLYRWSTPVLPGAQVLG